MVQVTKRYWVAEVSVWADPGLPDTAVPLKMKLKEKRLKRACSER